MSVICPELNAPSAPKAGWCAALFALVLAGCAQGPFASVRMMDSVQIQAERSERLCNAWVLMTEVERTYYAVIANEIANRGLACGPNGALTAEAPPILTVAESATPTGTGMRAVSNVSMRAGPGTDYRVLGSLRVGQTITVLDRQEGWCECMASDGQRVFVACRYLEATSPGPDAGVDAAQGAPEFQEGIPYPQVRASLIGQGWSPFRLAGAQGCRRGDARCEGFSETVFCAGTGQATCWYTWRRGERYILIAGVLETEGQLFAELRECSAIRMSDEHPWDWCVAPSRAAAARRREAK